MVTICDICKKETEKLTIEDTIKFGSKLTSDLCDEHRKKLERTNQRLQKEYEEMCHLAWQQKEIKLKDHINKMKNKNNLYPRSNK